MWKPFFLAEYSDELISYVIGQHMEMLVPNVRIGPVHSRWLRTSASTIEMHSSPLCNFAFCRPLGLENG